MGSGHEEGGGGGGDGGVMVVMGRAEIDTSAPFRSVKEAVMLFGEKVLAGEIYGHRIHQMQAAAAEKRPELGLSRLSSIAAELEETRQNLEKAREESLEMANCLSSLRKELQKAKKELTQLKEAKCGSLVPKKQVMESEIEEDFKFVENYKTEVAKSGSDVFEFQKRRCVTFANPPSLAQVINPQNQMVLERQLSVDRDSVPLKKKKKPLIPLIGGMFSKKKNNNHHQHQEVIYGN